VSFTAFSSCIEQDGYTVTAGTPNLSEYGTPGYQVYWGISNNGVYGAELMATNGGALATFGHYATPSDAQNAASGAQAAAGQAGVEVGWRDNVVWAAWTNSAEVDNDFASCLP
jgi:hypothetical protein